MSVISNKKQSMTKQYYADKREREWDENFLSDWIRRDLLRTINEIEQRKRKLNIGKQL